VFAAGKFYGLEKFIAIGDLERKRAAPEIRRG